jgi:CheY-like chemotaxis protein
MGMKHSVLVVDDDSDDRHFIQEAFRLSNIDVDLVEFSNANNIVGALKNLDKEKPISLILLDLNLPGKNGFEALRELKQDEDCTHIPTVVLTTSSSDRDRNESYAMGASCFLSKPNSFEVYMKMLTSIFKLYIHPGIS